MADGRARTYGASMSVSRRALLSGGILAAAAVLTGCTGGPEREDGTGFDFDGSTPTGEVLPVPSRQAAPTFSGEFLDATPFASSSLEGDIVVLNFWGSWCAPCRVEMPDFQAVYADVAERGVQFLGVAVKDDRQLAQGFVRTAGVQYPSLFDRRGEVGLVFRGLPTNVVPSTILLDRQFRVAAVYVAVVSEADLRRSVEQLLAEGR